MLVNSGAAFLASLAFTSCETYPGIGYKWKSDSESAVVASGAVVTPAPSSSPSPNTSPTSTPVPTQNQSFPAGMYKLVDGTYAAIQGRHYCKYACATDAVAVYPDSAVKTVTLLDQVLDSKGASGVDPASSGLTSDGGCTGMTSPPKETPVFSAVPKNGSANLSWAAIGSAHHYSISRIDANGAATLLQDQIPADQTSQVLSGLFNNVTYKLVFSAWTSYGKSTSAAAVTLTPNPLTILGKGFIDSVDRNRVVHGWACLPGPDAIDVHFYDGPGLSPQNFLGAARADAAREAAVAAECGGQSARGFNFQLPSRYPQDGKTVGGAFEGRVFRMDLPHVIYAYGVTAEGSFQLNATSESSAHVQPEWSYLADDRRLTKRFGTLVNGVYAVPRASEQSLRLMVEGPATQDFWPGRTYAALLKLQVANVRDPANPELPIAQIDVMDASRSRRLATRTLRLKDIYPSTGTPQDYPVAFDLASHQGNTLPDVSGRISIRLSTYGNSDLGFSRVRVVASSAFALMPFSDPVRCLEIANGQLGDGALSQIHPCASGPNQVFYAVPSEDHLWFHLFAQHSYKALDANAGESLSTGAAIIQYAFHGGPNQTFQYDPKYRLLLRSATDPQAAVAALDAWYSESTKQDVPVKAYGPMNDGANEKWALLPVKSAALTMDAFSKRKTMLFGANMFVVVPDKNMRHAESAAGAQFNASTFGYPIQTLWEDSRILNHAKNIPVEGFTIQVANPKKTTTTGMRWLLGDEWFSSIRHEWADIAYAVPLIKRAVQESGKQDLALLVRSGVMGADDPATFNFVDDSRWAVIENNSRVIARLAREAGLKHVFIDFEGYSGGFVFGQVGDLPDGQGGLFTVHPYDYFKDGRQIFPISDPNPAGRHHALLRQRGAQAFSAMLDEHPDLEIFYIHGEAELAYDGDASRNPELRGLPSGEILGSLRGALNWNYNYEPLAAAFMDGGRLAAQKLIHRRTNPKAVFHHAQEDYCALAYDRHRYWYRTRQQKTADNSMVNHQYKMAFDRLTDHSSAIWFDLFTDASDVPAGGGKNGLRDFCEFTQARPTGPQKERRMKELSQAYSGALTYSDHYMWIYAEGNNPIFGADYASEWAAIKKVKASNSTLTAPGIFKDNGGEGIYYSNGTGAYCIYPSPEALCSKGGYCGDDIGRVLSQDPGGLGLTLGGSCGN